MYYLDLILVLAAIALSFWGIQILASEGYRKTAERTTQENLIKWVSAPFMMFLVFQFVPMIGIILRMIFGSRFDCIISFKVAESFMDCTFTVYSTFQLTMLDWFIFVLSDVVALYCATCLARWFWFEKKDPNSLPARPRPSR